MKTVNMELIEQIVKKQVLVDITQPIYADLKGPAYQSYVCPACVEELAKEAGR